jgi:hypothetical protein
MGEGELPELELIEREVGIVVGIQAVPVRSTRREARLLDARRRSS